MEDWLKILISTLAGFIASTLLEPIRLKMGQHWRTRAFRNILYRELGVHLHQARMILKMKEAVDKMNPVIPPDLKERLISALLQYSNAARHDSQQVFDYYISHNPDNFYSLPDWRVMHGLFMHVKATLVQKTIPEMAERANIFVQTLEAAGRQKVLKISKIEKEAKAHEKFYPQANSLEDIEALIKMIPPLRIQD